jgi:hypothetical protein
MRDNTPPIVKLAQRTRAEIEIAVLGFARFHKYQVGAVLRSQAQEVVRCAQRAWRDRARRREWVQRLVWAVDDLKDTHQLAQDVRAFRSFKQFEALARTLAALGQQCGGWQKEQHRNGQNSQATNPARRAEILSARGASCEANE